MGVQTRARVACRRSTCTLPNHRTHEEVYVLNEKNVRMR